MPGECPACCSSGPFSPRACMEPFRLLECAQCNSVFLFPQPSETELALFYNETYYGKARKKFVSAAEAGVAALTRLKWNRLRPLLGDTGPLLDIGCGRGTLLKLARAAGVEAYGIERPSPLGHSVSNVVAKDLRKCSFPDRHFQLVVLWHVLEHLHNPAQTLREIHRILKPGGWLSVAVPNYGGAQAQASGPRWFHLDPPRHLWHFRRPALQSLLENSGLRAARWSTFSLEYDWFGTLQSWMNRALQDDNHLYGLLRSERVPPVAESARLIATGALLALPALSSALWDAARGQGGTLTVTAQKTAP